MFLPKLYNKRSDGQLQEWAVEVDGGQYRMISGMVDGAKVTSAWTVAVVKNEGRANATTVENQAAAEAQSKWQKKWDGGYREHLADLESVDLIEPMLALKYKDCIDNVTFPMWCQPKLDGVRCIARPIGLFTRKGKPHTNMAHVQQDLVSIFEKYPTLVIDGEAYASHLSGDFNAIISLVKKGKPDSADRAASAASIRYHVYDGFFTDNPGMPFGERNKKIQEILYGVSSVVIVETVKAKDQEELDSCYSKWLEQGFEGQMLRTDTAYEVGKRAKALLKRKEFIDEEYTVADVEEGKGNRAGGAGAIVLTTGDKAGIRGDRAFVVGLLKNKAKLIGKLVTVRYQNKTPAGALRFPVMVAVRDPNWD
jgi:DNA ligase-1